MTKTVSPSLAQATVGSVVLLSDFSSDELLPAIVRQISDESVTVVPLSGEVCFATEWDLLLDRTLLGYAAIAQVWNFGTALSEQIVDVVAALNDSGREALDALALAARTGAQLSTGLPVGPPVLDQADPRLLRQEEDADRTHRFWAPALALAGAETLGQLVHHRRDELRVDATELEELIEAGGWLGDLESDRLDIKRTLPVSTLALLLRRLQIVASRRLGRITTWTIEAHAPSIARKSREEGSEGLADTDDYVAELLRALGDD